MKKKNGSGGQKKFYQNESITPAFMPKPYQAQPMQRRKFRYNVTANGSAIVTRATLLNRLIIQETGGTQNNRLFKSVRLDRVTIYGTGTAASNGMRTINLIWNQTQTEITAVGNAAFPPKLRLSPPANTLASLWSITGTDETEVLFTISNLIGDTIDIDITYVLADGFSTFVTTPAATYDGLVAPWLDALTAGSYAPAFLNTPG